MLGEKLKCEEVLPRDVMLGKITEYYFYRFMSMYLRKNNPKYTFLYIVLKVLNFHLL